MPAKYSTLSYTLLRAWEISKTKARLNLEEGFRGSLPCQLSPLRTLIYLTLFAEETRSAVALYSSQPCPLSTLRSLALLSAARENSKRINLNLDEGFRGSLPCQPSPLRTLRDLTLFAEETRSAVALYLLRPCPAEYSTLSYTLSRAREIPKRLD